MEQKGVQLDRESFSCSVCLDLLKEPVTIPCGHSYCTECIQSCWAEEDEDKVHHCPQCRQTFPARPVLVKSTMLAVLVEELKRSGLQAAPADHCYAGAEDVNCDVCTGRKLRASKSCLVCVASFCEQHLQPHYDVASFKKHKLVDPSKKHKLVDPSKKHQLVDPSKKHQLVDPSKKLQLVDPSKKHQLVDPSKKHQLVDPSKKDQLVDPSKKDKLVDPSKKLQDNVCSRHDEVMKTFCRTDQQCICFRCSVDEHKGHDTVSAAAERRERQREVEESRQIIQQRIQDAEKDLKLLEQQVKNLDVSADQTVEDREKIFSRQVRSQQQKEVGGVRELQEKLEQEITELKRKDQQLEQLTHTEDHNQFLLSFPSLSALSESTHSTSFQTAPLRHFEDVTAAVSEVPEKLQDVLSETWTNVSVRATGEELLLPQPEPTTRADFLRHSRELTLDPNTAHTQLLLSEGNRKVSVMKNEEPYSEHPDRFTSCEQVLSRESLTGRCYWEVERRGGISLAVAYKNISREDEGLFGVNDKSWALECSSDSYTFYHDTVDTPVSGPPSSRLGVYLHHTAGVLSFFSVSETMTLLHRVQTTFTQPLLAGVWNCYYDSSCEFMKLK